MKVVYLAHKIRDERGIWYHNLNIRAAEAIALELWRMGAAVICPGKNTENYDGSTPDDIWLDGDLEIVSRCDAVVMAPGWQTSTGAKGERKYALAKRIPVYDWETEKNTIQAFLKQRK